MSVYVTHGRVHLMIHELRPGHGTPLLLLHGLGERSPETVPDDAARWRGPVYALDFTGHGESSIPHGGGYTPEVLMGDVDAALLAIGPSTILARGLGAYVALLAAGGRPAQVRGAILCDGPGLTGGDGMPDRASLRAAYATVRSPDPIALVELSGDYRPPAFALRFVHLAAEKSGLPQPLAVAAVERPPWLAAVAAEPFVTERPVPSALAMYGSTV